MSDIIRGLPRDLRSWAKLAEAQGWTILKRGSGHYLWRSPNGGTVTSASSTNGGRAVANTVAQLKRNGLRET